MVGGGEPPEEPEKYIKLVKGNNLENSKQVEFRMINNGIDHSERICPSKHLCRRSCKLINPLTAYHPGTDDQIVNYNHE